MINLDSEAEGIFTVSCAGGSMARCVLPVSRAPFAGTALEVTVRGLAGGHSGTEIDKEGQTPARRWAGCSRPWGWRRSCGWRTSPAAARTNAIPTEARARIAVSDEAAARRAVEKIAGGPHPGVRRG